MPAVEWTDAVLNARADGSWVQPDEVRAHTDDPGAAGTSNTISGSSTALSWEDAGVEGPLGASQPATVGRAWAAPTIALADDATYLTFWASSVYQGRVLTVQQPVPAGTYTPSLALSA